MGKRIYQGGTIEFYTKWKNRDKMLTDPSVLSLQVIKPDGTDYWVTAKAIGDWTKSSTGIYYYPFDTLSTDPIGIYHVVVIATVDTHDDPRADSFEVVALP